MATLPALVVSQPRYHFWNKITTEQQNFWIEIARDYQNNKIKHTPQAIVFIPNIAVLPHDLAPPVKGVEKILRYEDFNINALLISGITVQYNLGRADLFLRQIPYISQNTFPILWKQESKNEEEWRMIMAGLRIGAIFFITVDLPSQYHEFFRHVHSPAHGDVIISLYRDLENIHNAWIAALDNAKKTITPLELFREYIVNGIAATTSEVISNSFLDRVTRHYEWATLYFNSQASSEMKDIERHVQRIRLSLTGRRLNRQYLDEYETIIEFPHAYYAVTKPIRIDYAMASPSGRPPHRKGLIEWARPRQPPTRYLLILPKIGFEPEIFSRSVTILSERQVGHPHLYRDGHACYGDISTLFGDAYASGNYTTMLIRAAHMLRLWNPSSPAASIYDYTLDKNLIICEEKCCECARPCNNRCRFCLYTTPDEFIRCELDTKDQQIDANSGRDFHFRSEQRDRYLFACYQWQRHTLSMCCAENQCPYYTGYWTPDEDHTYPCSDFKPCAHCPEKNCSLRKNPFINTADTRSAYTAKLRKIRNKLRARFKMLEADEMPEE